MTASAAVYHGAPVPASQNYNRGTSPVAYPLPPELQPYYDAIVNLAKKTGYAFFRLKWVLSPQGWNMPRWKFHRIIRKLQYYGRLIVEEVPGSHARFFTPIPLRKRAPKPASPPSDKPAPEPAPENPDSGAQNRESGQETPEAALSAPPAPESLRSEPLPLAAQLLVSRGFEGPKALEITDGVPLRDVQVALAAYDDYASRKKVLYPLRYIEDAIANRWAPPKRSFHRSPVKENPPEEPKKVPPSPLPGIDESAVKSAAGKVPGLARLLEKYGNRKIE